MKEPYLHDYFFPCRTGYRMSGHAAAHFIRREMADSLREHPWQVNLLLGSVDDNKAGLYFIDYLGSLAEPKFCAHGYGMHFILGLLDSEYREDMTMEEVCATSP